MNYNFFITRKMAKKKFWFSICGLSVTNLISFTQRKQKSLILLYFQIISLNNSCVYASLPTDRRHTRPHFASIVILSARRLLHRLMTYLFRANGGKHEGWIAKKKRSSLRSRLAFASVHLENEKIASLFWKLRHLILGEKFPTLSWAEILLFSFSQRRVANRISPIFNNDHARFNECNIFAQISASGLRKFFEKPAYMRPSKGVSISPCRSFTNTPFAYLVREIPSHIHYLI